jgi:hypothetical protein
MMLSRQVLYYNKCYIIYCGILTIVRGIKSQGITREIVNQNSWDKPNVHLDKLWIIPSPDPHKNLTNGQGIRPTPQPFSPTLCLAHSFFLILFPPLPMPHSFPLNIKDVSL